MSLKNSLKEHRKRNNFTQEELGDKVGVSRQTIISIEKYKYKPSMELGLKLAMELKVQVGALFFLVDQ